MKRFFVRSWGQALLLVALMVVGLWARLEDLGPWRAAPERAFHREQPILTTLDGYFYLRLARDLFEHSYDAVDNLRGVPRHPQRPFPPPLLSALACGIMRTTSFSLDWIGAVLPAVLGVLLIIPLYGLAHLYGGRICGIVGAGVTLLSPYYIGRSGLGWFDTDCMNLTWLCTVTLFALLFGTTADKRRYVALGASLCAGGLFLWWWDFGAAVVVGTTLSILVLSTIALFRPARKLEWAWLAAGALAISMILLSWKGWGYPAEMADDIGDFYRHIAKSETGVWPSTGAVIGEEVRPTLKQIALWSIGSRPAFILTALGFGWLLLKRRRAAFPLVPTVALGALSFLFARRFILFLVPIAGLGIGFAVSEAWRLRRRIPILPYLAGVAVAAVATDLVLVNRKLVQWPAEDPRLVAGLERIAEVTPRDAVIWALWDHGYAINYFARRATIVDGSIHGGELLVYASMPFAAEDPRLAAEFMYFYAAAGKKGMRKINDGMDGPKRGLALTREALSRPASERAPLLDSLSKEKHGKRPMSWPRLFSTRSRSAQYLLLDRRLEPTAPAWVHFGGWACTQQHPPQLAYSMSTFAKLWMKDRAAVGASFRRIAAGDGWSLWLAAASP